MIFEKMGNVNREEKVFSVNSIDWLIDSMKGVMGCDQPVNNQ
jgi:hypothetical protein